MGVTIVLLVEVEEVLVMEAAVVVVVAITIMEEEVLEVTTILQIGGTKGTCYYLGLEHSIV